MLKHLSLLFLVLVLSPSISSLGVPGMKFSIDFGQIDVFKNATLRPLIEENLVNLTIQGPIDINLSMILATVQVQLSNISLKNFSLNWDKTVLAPVSESQMSLTLFDADIIIENDYDIKFLELDLKGRANITVTNLTVCIIAQFDNLTYGSGFTMSIANFSLNYDSIKMDVDSTVITYIVDSVFKTFKCVLIQYINKMVMGDLNQKIAALTSQVIQIPISASILSNMAMKLISPKLDMPKETNDVYIINITTYTAPYVRYQNDTTGFYSYLTLAIDIDIFNNRTKATPTIKEKDLLPYRISFDYDIQAFLCNSLLTQLQWLIIDSGILKLTLDDGMLTNISSPVRLNTSSIMLLVPGMTTLYGLNKGIYLKVQAGSTYSQIVFRSGRLVGEVSLILDFYVDKDSSKYPNGLENCTACELALSLNATMLLALHADNHNESLIYANIINIDFYYVTVLSKTIDFDVITFQNLMKDVGRSFVPILNAGLQGIPNPLIGKYGIKDLQFRFAVDYLFLKVVIQEDKKKEIMS